MVRSDVILEYIKYLTSALNALMMADNLCVPIAPSKTSKLLSDLQEERRRAKKLYESLRDEEGRIHRELHPEVQINEHKILFLRLDEQ